MCSSNSLLGSRTLLDVLLLEVVDFGNSFLVVPEVCLLPAEVSRLEG